MMPIIQWLKLFIQKPTFGYLVSFALAALLIGPGLRSGNIFLLDMSWPEHFSWNNVHQNIGAPQFPITFALYVFNTIVPAWVLQKALLLFILSAIGINLYRLATTMNLRHYQAVVAVFLGILNPFVAERLLGGQWLVLAGYAYLPFILMLLLKLLQKPSKKNAWKFALSYILFPIVSVHWWYIASPLLLLILIFERQKLKKLFSYYPKVWLQAMIAFLVIHGYWLINFLTDGGKLSAITKTDFQVFQTASDRTYGLFANIISGYGFWYDKLQTPKDFNRYWLLWAIIIMFLAIFGAVLVLVRKEKKLDNVRSLTLSMLSILPIIFFIISGYGFRLTKPLVSSLFSVPGFSGLRDTSKLSGLVVLFVGLFAPIGISYAARVTKTIGKERLYAGLLIVFTLIIMNGMLFGARGQIKAYSYPKSYSQLQLVIDNRGITQPILTLPWKGYLKLEFAGNQYVANPARVYFNADIVSSKTTGNNLLDRNKDPLDKAMIAPYNSEKWIQDVLDLGYEYIIIQKTDTWLNYSQILKDTEVIYDSSEVALVKL